VMFDEDGTVNVDSWDPTDTLSSFSNVGPCCNIIAPGQEILAAYSSDGSTHLTASLDGTSMATPLTAGVALTIRGQHPTLSPVDVTRALICISQNDIVGGSYITPYTPNRLLQGGARVVTEWSDLIASQQELTVAQRLAGVKPVWDATRCRAPEVSEEAAASPTNSISKRRAAATPLQP